MLVEAAEVQARASEIHAQVSSRALSSSLQLYSTLDRTFACNFCSSTCCCSHSYLFDIKRRLSICKHKPLRFSPGCVDMSRGFAVLHTLVLSYPLKPILSCFNDSKHVGAPSDVNDVQHIYRFARPCAEIVAVCRMS